MRKYFITGLALLLPLALTLAIVIFAVNLFTNPFVEITQSFFTRLDILQNAKEFQLYLSRFVILVLLFFSTVLLGWLTRWVVVHYLIRLSDQVMHRIPIVRTIYKTSQDVIKTIFADKERSFKQVVLVPFPNKKTLTIGLVTREEIKDLTENEKHLVAVFVPTTPNPTSGFLMMFQPKEIVYLDMSVENAFKYVISCGVILSPFKKGKNKND